ncbi:unnamed protein product [Discosporangium mesarthrocarpum]
MLSSSWLLLVVGAIGSMSAAEQGTTRRSINSGHPDAVVAAEFAVQELQKLSDTGIYRTLTLKKIVDAATGDGVFHRNVFLQLELGSSYFKSRRTSETFNVMVMKHKEDGHRSFAIDNFPEMDVDAMEEFYIEEVERQREAREVFLNSLETTAQGELESLWQEGTTDQAALATKMMSMSATELMALLEGTTLESGPVASAAQEELNKRWKSSTEGQLSLLNMGSLKEVVKNPDSGLPQKEHAKKILSERIRSLDQQESYYSLLKAEDNT